MHTNLEHLQPGDQLATSTADSGWGRIPRVTYAISTIERVTATQIVCTNALRVRRTDGQVVGNSYNHAIHADERIVAENATQKAAQAAHYALAARERRLVEGLSLRRISSEALTALVEAYERFYPAHVTNIHNSAAEIVAQPKSIT